MKNIFVFISIILITLQSCNTSEKKENDNATLLSDPQYAASSAFLTSDENNIPMISWIEMDSSDNKNFYFAKWDKDAQNFSSRKTIPIEQNASIHTEGMPKFAVKGDGTIVAIYETSIPSETNRFGLSDIKFVSSTDEGNTWTEPQSIQSDGLQIGSRSFSGILRLDDGEVGVSWLGTNPDKKIEGRPVKFAKTNSENSFEKEILIDSTACECCRTALSSNGQGEVSLVYRDLLPGSVRDISISHSKNNGKDFAESVAFSRDGWVIDGCPHNGPAVVSHQEKTFVTWFTAADEKGVFYAELDNNNQITSKIQLSQHGNFAQLALMPDESKVIVYDEDYEDEGTKYNKIIVNKVRQNEVFEKEISTPHTYGTHPAIQVATEHDVIVAWEDKNKIYCRLVKTNSIQNLKKKPNDEIHSNSTTAQLFEKNTSH
ncbi:MAG TPA: sialidase family protein [Candidatus Sphingobacterium stercoripullorum]|nr:sialidase family protein [Candidatus Sphingobacterium stercoripullorum]